MPRQSDASYSALVLAAVDFFFVVVLRVVVFLAVDDLDDDLDDAARRVRRLVGPAARYSASRRKASAGSIDSGVYCLGSVRFVSPSVIYAP